MDRIDQANRVERVEHATHIEHAEQAQRVELVEQTAAQQAVPNQEPENNFASRLTKLLPEWTSIAAVSASILGLGYVALNAGYVKFYEGLGVHPEEVGFDRVAIIGRTASFAFIAIFFMFLIVLMVAVPRQPKWRFPITLVLQIVAFGLSIYGILERKSWLIFISNSMMLCLLYLLSAPLGEVEFRNGGAKVRIEKVMQWFFVIFSVVVSITACWRLDDSIQRRISEVRRGHEVHPINFGAYPLIDISATHVRWEWIDSNSTPPKALNNNDLLFLGRDSNSASFVTKGHTIVVPNLKIAIEEINP
ncbi:hypothetical protein ACWC2T_43315 [Streptomyces sp. NPDC001393]